MSTKRYVLIFILVLAALIGGVSLFNRVVDPFWYYRDLSIPGFNAIKTKFRYYERSVKPSIVQREQPASLILGSSYSEIGLNPLHPALTAAGKSYNFALVGAGWDLVSCSAQFSFLHDAALRQIVLGIHTAEMPRQNCKDQIAKMEHPDELAFLLSRKAFEASINTVFEQHKNKGSHTIEGMYMYINKIPGTAIHFRRDLSKHKKCDVGSDSRNNGAVVTPSHPVADITGLRDVIREAVAQKIVMKLFVYPRHALAVEQEYQCGERQQRWDILAQILAMVEQEGHGYVELWDFDGYHAIGTEWISDAPGIYWQDIAHFNPAFGNVILDEMFSLAPRRFGARITTENLAVHATEERKAREAYIKEHPEFLAQLKALWSN